VSVILHLNGTVHMYIHTYIHACIHECIDVTLSHLRSKEPPGLQFICNPTGLATYNVHLGSDYIEVVRPKLNVGIDQYSCH